MEHYVITSITILGYFWPKVDIALYNSEVAKCFNYRNSIRQNDIMQEVAEQIFQ